VKSSVEVPILWHFRVLHYNEKVRWALDHKNCPHLRRALVPGFHIPVVRWISGQNMLPLVKLGDRVVAGSNNILAELEGLCPQPPLFPASPELRQRVMKIQEYFDEQAAPDLRRLFWSTYIGHPAACARMATDGFSSMTRHIWRSFFPVMRPLFRRNMGMDAETLLAARKRLVAHFDRLEHELGTREYLVGDKFGVADLTAAAVMTAIARPLQFPYPLPEPWPVELIDLRQSVSRHSAFQWVLEIYSRHRGTSKEIVVEQSVAGDASASR